MLINFWFVRDVFYIFSTFVQSLLNIRRQSQFEKENADLVTTPNTHLSCGVVPLKTPDEPHVVPRLTKLRRNISIQLNVLWVRVEK